MEKIFSRQTIYEIQKADLLGIYGYGWKEDSKRRKIERKKSSEKILKIKIG